LVKYEKNQEKPKLFQKNLAKNPRLSENTQEPKVGSKKPRSWEKTQGVATLERMER